MFDVFCLGLALTVGQGDPAVSNPKPLLGVDQQIVADDLPRRIPAALPSVTVPSVPTPIPGRVPGVIVLQQKDTPPAKTVEPKRDAPAAAETTDCQEEKKEEEKGHFMSFIESTPFGCWMEEHRLKVYGFTEVSYTATSAGRQINWPMLFQSPTNTLLLNQNWLTIERTIDADSACPSWGFRVDAIVPGSDARFVRQRGLFGQQNERNQFDLYQFYLEYNIPGIAEGLNIKVGRMAVPYMAEVTPAADNSLFSHSYAYYYNPYTHTGVWATLKLNEEFSAGIMATLGNDVWFTSEADGMFVGVFQWAAKDGNDSALLCVGLSNGQFNVAKNFSQQNHIDLVYKHNFSECFRSMLDIGIGWEDNIPGVADTTWSWIVKYFTYDFTDQVSGTTRFELFHDAEGFKTGFEGSYLAATAGLTFKPTNSILFRPELRYDRNTETKPFGGKDHLFSAAADFIVRW